MTNGPNGPNTRVVLQLPAGYVLPADHYRFYIPNNSATLVIRDIFKNQLDGEFLGDPSAQGGTDLNGNPTYEDLLPNGQYRSGMSGDGVGGGSFTAGFVVVPTGNLIYARPGYLENPLLPSTEPNGSISQPYPVLAPQAVADAANQATINDGNPNDGLNATINFTNFNPAYDRAALGTFARSAFYAASQLAMNGPVVIVALPGIQQVDPTTGLTSQKTFVLQAPAGSDPSINNGSASVPYDTMLVFNPGSTLKLENASLFVQNQGSALQTIGGTNPSDQVTFTSVKDNSVGSNPFGPAGASNPAGGDWGGVVFRNFDDAIAGRTDTFPVDGTLVGPNLGPAVSGADDSLSEMIFTNVRYGGGSVPSTNGVRYDQIELYNSRPMIAQDSITLSSTNGTQGVQAGISADLDSFREDDTRRGPLFRRDNLANNSLNGIWVRPDLSGAAEVTDAEIYPSNPLFLGGAQNYTFDAPIPYIFTSRLDIGTEILSDTQQQTAAVTDRLYIQPGMLLKFQRGAGIEILTPGSSINVGQRTYIAGFDSDVSPFPVNGMPASTWGPLNADGSPNVAFQTDALGAAQVLFTSLYDNTATTSYTDPLTGLVTTIVPMVDSANTDPTSKYGAPGPIDPYQPSDGNVPAAARWGSITVNSGAIAAIDQAIVRFAGGSLNSSGGTIIRNALTIYGSQGFATATPNANGVGFTYTVNSGRGGRVMITNDTFDSNSDAPIYADPDALLATNPLTPLASGHPFFHGNILTNNAYNALAVGGGSVGYVGPPGNDGSNLSNTSVWDQTDITYLVRGSIVPNLPTFFNFNNGGGTGTGSGGIGGIPTPPPLGAITKPSIVLTIQSALPGTLLANGQTIATPGASVIVKMMGAGTGDAVNGQNGLGVPASSNGGAGFLFGVDNGVDPPAGDPTIDQGNNSQLRILGIGGDETTSQPRVPVYITSIHDSTVGPTVNGVPQNQVIPGDTQAPAPGDGGVIDFGGNSLTTYNALDIREGNKIDNADIRYITRIEMQGGGNIDTVPISATGNTGSIDNLRAGVLPPLANGSPNPNDGYIQRNAPKELTVSDSNFSDFSQVGILAHPGFDLIETQSTASGVAGSQLGTRATGTAGEPNQLFLYNDTFADMPVGVRMVGQNDSDDSWAPNPHELLLLNNTFYNDAIGVDIVAQVYNGVNIDEQVHVAAMDNIFSNSSTAAIQSTVGGMTQGSVLEYNLYNADTANVTGPLGGVNFQPIIGNPEFVAAVPNDPSADNFDLQAGSAAIDAARSELDLNDTSTGAFIGTLVPTDTQVLNATGGIRNTNDRLPEPDGFANNGNINQISNELTLPGYGSTQPSLRGFVDEWEAVLPTASGAIAGPASNASTFDYAPVIGERDVLGNLRQKDPNSPNVGFGSRPFFDIGAFEYRIFNPPHITGVTAIVTDATSATGTSTVNLYGVGTPAGTNKPIQTIQVTFDDPIDPSTLTSSSVVLEASNGTGNFTNPIFYNLSGKLSLDPTDRILTINLGSAGLVLNNDEYRLIIYGNGPDVVKDTTGLALDGQDVKNDNPANPQLALPSGSGAPGTNFFDTFVLNTAAPAVVPFTFGLDPSTDSNIVGDDVTNVNLPAFSGNVSVPLPNIESLSGLTVVLDISTLGNGVFDRMDAGTAVTDATGHFIVTVGQDAAKTGLVTNTSPLPDSFYNVGPDGILRTGDDYGYTWARVRIIDQSGNASDQPTDTPAQFAANNALDGAVIDTAPPIITSFSPTPNTLIQPTNGTVTFTFTTNKNISLASLNANSIIVTNTSTGVAVPINAGSITIKYLGNQTDGGTRLGPEQISFTVSTTTNGYYSVTLKGTGANPITDIAGNDLAGNGTTAGTDFTTQYPIISPTLSLIYVSAAATPTVALPADGTIENPYPTIKAAMAVATPGSTIAVLPGVYTENVVMKAFVRLVSADPSSTDSVLVPGNPLTTVIRAPEPSATSTFTGANVTILAADLPYVPGVETEVSGFSIASPLLGTTIGNGAEGPIDPTTIAVGIQNANLLLENNYITDAQIGVEIETESGTGVLMPRVINNVIAGNINGIEIDDVQPNTIPNTAKIYNDDIVYNTIGLLADNTATSKPLATVANDIFWENHDLTTARSGFGIEATVPGSLIVGDDLFQGNGASDTNPTLAGLNVGNGFNAASLTATPNAVGNYTGNPAFVFPVDPRPEADGPATFYLDADFDLQSSSVAIDAANGAFAPPTDILGRGRVKIAGKGFPGRGLGPADVGAFEFDGSGGQTLTGAFAVSSVALTTSTTTVPIANTTVAFSAQTAPKAITVSFTKNVNRATVTPSSLVLYGDGLSSVGGAHATSVTWLNGTTAKFTLSGNYSTQGTVMVKLNTGSIKSTTNLAIAGFSTSFVIKPAVSAAVTTPTTAKPVVTAAPTPVTPVVTPTTPVKKPVTTAPITPPPAAAPKTVVSKTPAGPLASRSVVTKKKK